MFILFCITVYLLPNSPDSKNKEYLAENRICQTVNNIFTPLSLLLSSLYPSVMNRVEKISSCQKSAIQTLNWKSRVRMQISLPLNFT